MAVVPIGTGETRTTIASWESNDLGGTLTEVETGECKGEIFDRVTINGSTTSAANYIHLTANSANYHDGRAQAVAGGTGFARVDGNLTGGAANVLIADDHVRVSWLEYYNAGRVGGSNNRSCIEDSSGNIAATNDLQVHHCIIHNDDASTSTGNAAVRVNDPDCNYTIYRNIFYGMGSSGVRASNGVSHIINANTIFECDNGGNDSTRGIWVASGVTATVKNNVCCENGDGTNDDFRLDGTMTTADNWSSDATSPETGNRNITTTSQFVNATTTWASTDLLVKDSSADIADGGGNLGSPYDTDITNTAVTGTWDAGADELAGGGGGGGIVVLRRRREGY